MQILYKEPGEKAQHLDVEDIAQAWGLLIGHTIETVRLSQSMLIICNENGKITGLRQNIRIPMDVVVGPIFVVAQDGDEIVGLNEGQADWALDWLESHSV